MRYTREHGRNGPRRSQNSVVVTMGQKAVNVGNLRSTGASDKTESREGSRAGGCYKGLSKGIEGWRHKIIPNSAGSPSTTASNP